MGRTRASRPLPRRTGRVKRGPRRVSGLPTGSASNAPHTHPFHTATRDPPIRGAGRATCRRSNRLTVSTRERVERPEPSSATASYMEAEEDSPDREFHALPTLRSPHRLPRCRETPDGGAQLPVVYLPRRVALPLALLEERPQRWQQRPSGQPPLQVSPRAPISTCSVLRTSRERRGGAQSPHRGSPGLIWRRRPSGH